MVTGPIFNVPAFIEMVAVVVVMGWPLYIHSMVGMGKPDAEQGSSSSFPSRTGLSRCGFFVNFGGTRTVTIACRTYLKVGSGMRNQADTNVGKLDYLLTAF